MSLASIQRTATKLCGKFGRTVTFNRYTPLRLPSGKVEKGAPTLTFTTSAVVLPSSSSTVEAFDNGQVQGTLAGKKRCFMQVAGQYATFAPRSMDEVEIPSLGAGDDYAGTWLVLGCGPIAPNGLPITYGVGASKL